jgi:seryl-tRNA synthetase
MEKQRRLKREYEEEKNEKPEQNFNLNTSLIPVPTMYYIINENFQENFPYFMIPVTLF